jgi:hypothetical protein
MVRKQKWLSYHTPWPIVNMQGIGMQNSSDTVCHLSQEVTRRHNLTRDVHTFHCNHHCDKCIFVISHKWDTLVEDDTRHLLVHSTVLQQHLPPVLTCLLLVTSTKWTKNDPTPFTEWEPWWYISSILYSQWASLESWYMFAMLSLGSVGIQ